MIKRLFREEASEQCAAVPPWHDPSTTVQHTNTDANKFKASMLSADECLLVSGLVMNGRDTHQHALATIQTY
jgi:hypothetical protein